MIQNIASNLTVWPNAFIFLIDRYRYIDMCLIVYNTNKEMVIKSHVIVQWWNLKPL